MEPKSNKESLNAQTGLPAQTGKQPRCIICGQFYRANLRVKTRQKTCGKKACQKERKKIQEKEWRGKDPEYYKNFYQDYIISWRKEHHGYQKAWRAKKSDEIKTEIAVKAPIKSIRLHLRLPMPDFEIKTQLFRLTKTDCGYWIDGVKTQVSRDKNGDRHKNGTSLEPFL